jgi:5S rRNA maturation endonuclease (ribonuclease M5)
MEFFKKYFVSYKEYDTGELEVLCPFPHTDEKGQQYYEAHPSAHISQSKNLFHCKVCGVGLSETAFLSRVQGISYKDAIILLKDLEDNKQGSWEQPRSNFLSSQTVRKSWYGLGLNDETQETLQIGYEGEGFSFPVYIYGELLDIRNYAPGRKPKVMGTKGAKSLLLPFDVWRQDEKPTLLCAGEKDMAIARQMGFNALTFTGGEQAFPKLFKHSFKGKIVYIAYDNDQAGHEGSRKIASLLKDCGAIPYVVTDHYTVCTEKGEDIHDFFIKYKKNAADLQTILDNTIEFTAEEHRTEQQKYIPLVSIEESTKGRYTNRIVSSRVSVTATFEEAYQVPEYVEYLKYESDDGAMSLNETRVFSLDEENAQDILHLMDSNLKEQQIQEALKRLARLPYKEKFISTATKSRINVFKAVVTDDMESEVVQDDTEDQSTREMLVYSIGEPIKAGHKYRIFYKPTPHPLKGQQVVGVVTKLEESDNSINRFNLNDKVLSSLDCFKVKPGETVKDKMNELYERSKGIIGVESRKDIYFATDLFYHTPLEFNFSKRTERGTLDVMVVGPERSGKSQAAKKLMQMYELGTITSLKTATTAGLLGGSDQTAGGWKTKLGLIPRNHKGALILEEFSGGGQELISKLTEVRSSNRVRLARVNGSIDVKAQVRMLSISNVAKDSSGNTIPIRNYPHGIKIILDLVGTAEDIARYDFFLILDEPDHYTSPLDDFDEEPFEKESYQNRVRWVWSRKASQIQMDREVLQHIVDLGNDLNKDYNCHIKLFGPEAWKKLSRIAIACAGMVCSMSEDGQNLIVNKEHVDWAHKFLVACYDNKLFKLKEYVDVQRRLVECDDASVHALQGIYNTHAVMFKQLEMSTEMHRQDLLAMSGLEMKEFNKILNALVRFDFISMTSSKITPTVRFRTAMGLIDRNTFMLKVGER